MFIRQNYAETEVFTLESNEPKGVCVALPRSNKDKENPSVIGLLGIICQGDESSRACFWDNQNETQSFPGKEIEVVPIQQFAGGVDLKPTLGGTWTSCHAREHTFIIHPWTALD